MREKVFTAPEAAHFLRCSANSLKNPTWRQSVGLPAVRIGRSLRFLQSDLVKFLQGQREVFKHCGSGSSGESVFSAK